jgi:hypothetical protein
MLPYPKIDTVYKRDPETRHKTLIIGDWSDDTFGYLANNRWAFTEKVDGTNIRVLIANKNVSPRITFGGKTDNASIPATLITKLEATFFPLADKLMEIFPEGACLYGEGYGAKIQKGGGNYRQDQDFVLFDVLVGDWWLQRDAVLDIGTKLNIGVAPLIGYGTLHDMIEWTKNGFTSTWGNFKAEGIVARPEVELKTRSGHRIITKIKHKDFQDAKAKVDGP